MLPLLKETWADQVGPSLSFVLLVVTPSFLFMVLAHGITAGSSCHCCKPSASFLQERSVHSRWFFHIPKQSASMVEILLRRLTLQNGFSRRLMVPFFSHWCIAWPLEHPSCLIGTMPLDHPFVVSFYGLPRIGNAFGRNCRFHNSWNHSLFYVASSYLPRISQKFIQLLLCGFSFSKKTFCCVEIGIGFLIPASFATRAASCCKLPTCEEGKFKLSLDNFYLKNPAF